MHKEKGVILRRDAFLPTGLFLLAILVLNSGCATNLEVKINSIVSEYAAKYPEPSKNAAETMPDEDRAAFVQEVKKVRQKWSKTMEPYAKRILAMDGETARILAEIARKDARELWQIVQEAVSQKEVEPKEYFAVRGVDRLCQRINFSLYTLEKMSTPGAEALGTLLKENHLCINAAISLGHMGKKEVLLEHFRDKNSTVIERTNSALGLTLFFGETETIPFLVSLFEKGTRIPEDFDVEFLWSAAALALSAVPKETIPVLLKAIERDRISEISLFYLSFLGEHGLDLQKALRLCLQGKEDGKVVFIYPTEPLPEERIKKFLAGFKVEEKLQLVIEFGGKVKYSSFDRLMTLCEQAGVYEVKMEVYGDEVFRSLLMAKSLSTRLAKPLESLAPSVETLFIEMTPASGEKRKEKGTCCILKLWSYKRKGFDIEKVVHKKIELSKEEAVDVPLFEQRHWLRQFVFNKLMNYHPTKGFKPLPVVFAPAPEITMDLVLAIVDIAGDAGVEDVNFLHHTRGCDWAKFFDNWKLPGTDPPIKLEPAGKGTGESGESDK